MSDARSVALEVIRRVVDDGGYSNLTLSAELDRARLDGRDRALATELAYGTVRRVLPIDRALGARANRSVDRMTPTARTALRLGAYQLLYTSIPPHAAVAETVELAGPRERGFVNAVLRRLAADRPIAPGGSGDDAIEARTGMQAWAVAELRALLGDRAEAAAGAFATPAPLCVRVNRSKTDVETLEAALAGAGVRPRRSRLHPDVLILEGGGDPRVLPGFDDGSFVVQDEASTFVAAAVDAQPGHLVLDACAAPGGKATFLAFRVAPDGHVVAADLRPGRAGLVAAASERLGARALVLAQDAARPALRPGFDRVLVDAPCSGIGSARRRPELLWRPRREELSRLARTQVAIASASAGLLRPGGRLVYSVCTFPRAETDAACDALLRHAPGLLPEVTPGPDGDAERHRLWPHVHGCDGMFVAAFRRRT